METRFSKLKSNFPSEIDSHEEVGHGEGIEASIGGSDRLILVVNYEQVGIGAGSGPVEDVEIKFLCLWHFRQSQKR